MTETSWGARVEGAEQLSPRRVRLTLRGGVASTAEAQRDYGAEGAEGAEGLRGPEGWKTELA